MPRALVALGTNLGDRNSILAQARERIASDVAVGPVRFSTPLETAPAGGPAGQEPFLNAAASFETVLPPRALLERLRAIEAELGRVRGQRWGARLIDLDILLYDDAPRAAGDDAPSTTDDDASGKPRILVDPDLQIPHPRMAFRRFALEPAVEVAPEMLHPIFGRTVEQLLDHLNHSPPLVAILGGTAAQRNELALEVARQTGAACIADPMPDRELPAWDSSGRSSAGPLQFLDQVAGLLATHDWQSPRWVVSAVSVQQAIAEIAASGTSLPTDLEPSKYEPLAAARLIVLLDDWSELVATRLGDRPLPGQTLRQTALFVASSCELPVLCAGRQDKHAQLAEITAAITAMQ